MFQAARNEDKEHTISLNRTSIDCVLFWLCLIIYTCFNVFYPTETLIISDEYSYLSLSQEILGQHTFSFLPRFHDYVLVYPFILGLFTFVVSVSNAWMFGVFSLLASIFTMHRTLKNVGNKYSFLLLFFFFFPVILFSRTLMSEVPTMLCVSIVLYLMIRPINIYNSALLVLVSVLSYGFREANAVLMTPLLLYYTLQNRQHTIFIVGIGLLSILMLLTLNYYFYGSAHYMRYPGVNFGFSHFWSNLGLIVYCTCILVPFGLWYVFKPTNDIHRAISLSIAGYLILHLVYQFNGIYHSGVRSLVTYPRFILPVLPLFIYIISLSNVSARIFQFVRLSVLPIMLCTLFMSYTINSSYAHISNDINAYEETHLIYTYDERNELFKISNPLTGLKVNIVESTDSIKDHSYYFLDINRHDTGVMKEATRNCIDFTCKEVKSWKNSLTQTFYTLYLVE